MRMTEEDLKLVATSLKNFLETEHGTQILTESIMLMMSPKRDQTASLLEEEAASLTPEELLERPIQIREM